MFDHNHKLLNEDVLFSIFAHLDQTDLLQAGLVCTMWNRMANKKCWWKTVILKRSVCIKNFKSMMGFLAQRGTKFLDLRCISCSENNFKEYLPQTISKLSSLKVLQLPDCNEETLESIFKTKHKMSSLSLSFRSVGRGLNLQHISNLSNLQSLQIVDNPTMDCSIHSVNCSSLGELKNLTSLELSSICGEDLTDFLGQLNNLKSLVIHYFVAESCTDFDISTLSSLEKLRIENVAIFYGQWLNLFEMLPKLKKLKELTFLNCEISFDFNYEAFNILKSCECLEKLLIADSYKSFDQIDRILENINYLFGGYKVFGCGIEIFSFEGNKFYMQRVKKIFKDKLPQSHFVFQYKYDANLEDLQKQIAGKYGCLF